MSFLSNIKQKPLGGEIVHIAFKIRKAVEKIAPIINDDVCGDIETLKCFCLIASYALLIALKKNGIKAKLIDGICDQENEWEYDHITKHDLNHSWIEVDDYFIDITATQFGSLKNDIEVIEKNNCEKFGYYPYKTALRLTEGFKKEWPQNQLPTEKYTKRILELAGI